MTQKGNWKPKNRLINETIWDRLITGIKNNGHREITFKMAGSLMGDRWRQTAKDNNGNGSGRRQRR